MSCETNWKHSPKKKHDGGNLFFARVYFDNKTIAQIPPCHTMDLLFSKTPKISQNKKIYESKNKEADFAKKHKDLIHCLKKATYSV